MLFSVEGLLRRVHQSNHGTEDRLPLTVLIISGAEFQLSFPQNPEPRFRRAALHLRRKSATSPFVVPAA